MRRLAPFALFAMLLAAAAPAAAAGSSRGTAMPPQARPFGTPLSEWVGFWLQWSLEVPASQNTVFHGDTCQVNQEGNVFFVPTSIDVGMHYTCTVPSGAHLLACPALAVGLLGLDADTVPEVRAIIQENLTHLTDVDMSVDGRPLDGLLERHLVVQQGSTTVDLPEDAIFGLPSGPLEIVGGGVCVMLHPLSVGHHVITMSDAFDPTIGTVASSTTNITVLPRGAS
jgi:hypothetical protein